MVDLTLHRQGEEYPIYGIFDHANGFLILQKDQEDVYTDITTHVVLEVGHKNDYINPLWGVETMPQLKVTTGFPGTLQLGGGLTKPVWVLVLDQPYGGVRLAAVTADLQNAGNAILRRRLQTGSRY